jgi:hypothetical protein
VYTTTPYDEAMHYRVYIMLIAVLTVAACAAPPPPSNPEMRQGGAFRPLSTVPERPEVSVPLYDRLQMENELAQRNTTARAAQTRAGLAAEPTLPDNPPAPPRELPEMTE